MAPKNSVPAISKNPQCIKPIILILTTLKDTTPLPMGLLDVIYHPFVKSDGSSEIVVFRATIPISNTTFLEAFVRIYSKLI